MSWLVWFDVSLTECFTDGGFRVPADIIQHLTTPFNIALTGRSENQWNQRQRVLSIESLIFLSSFFCSVKHKKLYGRALIPHRETVSQ